VNGSLHNRKVLNKDLMYALKGKKLIKSIQERIDEIRKFQFENDYKV
jgi:hypothetical protein